MAIDTNINIDIDFGQLLVEKKIITAEQLAKAFEVHKIKGGYLSQHLVELEYLKDTELANILTCQYGFCYLPLKAYDIQESALQLIPHNFACDYCVMPIEKNDKLLTVAMCDPLNKGVFEVLRQETSCEIIVFVSTQSDIKETIEKYYNAPFKPHQLDKLQNDPILRDNLTIRKISNGLYAGPNRRRYRRLFLEIVGEYFFYPHVIKTRIMNISLSGILFESDKPLPKGSQMAMNIRLKKGSYVTTVLEVCRCDAKYVISNSLIGNEDKVSYEIGAFYNFLSEENQDMLAAFLKHQFDT